MKTCKFLFVSILWLAACSPQEEVGYYKTGEVEYRVPLNKKGTYDGLYTYFYKTGAKKAELPFIHNHINGFVKRYYPSGVLLSTAVYKEGGNAGEIRSYYPTGELKSQGNMYGKNPQGTIRYFERNGVLKHLRIYNKKGKIVDFAEFKSDGSIDDKYTKAIIYTNNDTIEVDETDEFEVILASQASNDIRVKIETIDLLLDSLPGEFSKYKYLAKYQDTGHKCISGNVYQREHKGNIIITKVYPWRHCLYISAKKN